MKSWVPMNDQESEQVWTTIYEEFEFRPSTTIFPSLSVPAPFITYDVSSYYKAKNHEALYEDLENKVIHAFRNLTSQDELIYALEWQHEGYWFNPRDEIPSDEFGEWVVPPFPNGDYPFYLEQNFSWGYIGHPWEKSVIVFGDALISSLENQRPKLFQQIIRSNYHL
ncbi:DUF2716 domain-containing protein [Pseudalkalibacillus sp. Hm43]|uniref:DUF2716 domain-containing protein n=1 Tax=Pseudalkalibacillus sp. Hm43 TaxID=3450742 RepID=UPI003F420D5A